MPIPFESNCFNRKRLSVLRLRRGKKYDEVMTSKVVMTEKEQITKLTDALVLINDLCLDYDGFETVDGLKSLIDDIRNITIETLKGAR